MTSYRIVCTIQEPANQSHHHAHIVEVGIDTDSDGRANTSLSLGNVLAMIDKGDEFYTLGTATSRRASVETITCCGKRYIRTRPDNVLDNNLDELRTCSW